MNEDLSRKRLGRGLAALIGEIDQPAAMSDGGKQAIKPDGTVPIESIKANPRNPRRHFAEAELNDLAQSIREHGVVQPVVVRPAPTGSGYEIIAGERRWRAAQLAGITNLPVLIRDVTDRVALEIAIVENVQRADLNALEEAMGYQQLIDEHSYTQADLGQVIGKSRSHVANTLRLLKLPEPVRVMVADGALTAGHARTLVTAADPAALADRIVKEGLSVRQAEALAQQPLEPLKERPNRERVEKDADTIALERSLSDALGLNVTLSLKSRGGELRIAYTDIDQLEAVCRRLQRTVT